MSLLDQPTPDEELLIEIAKELLQNTIYNVGEETVAHELEIPVAGLQVLMEQSWAVERAIRVLGFLDFDVVAKL